MNTFLLTVRDSEHECAFSNVESFVGRDASGSFGIQARAEPVLAVLGFGLARFRTTDGACHYLALPEALLRFEDGALTLTATRFLSGDDIETLSPALEAASSEAASLIRSTKRSAEEIEQTLMRKLIAMSRAGGAA